MKLSGIAIKGFRLDKAGKIVRSVKHLDVSARLRMKGSRKIKIVRGKV